MKIFTNPLLLAPALLIVGAIVVFASNVPAFRSREAVGSPLEQSIEKAQKVVSTNPPITKPYISLAGLYLQKVRETSDATYYAKVDELMNEAEKVNPKDADIDAVRASAAMGRHEFKEGYAYIQKALSINKTAAAYYGLRGDAEIELGKYQEAVDSFQKMMDIRPAFSSWSRIAYIRELYGDIPGAKKALAEAISSGSNYPENIAWAYVELGKIDIRNDLAKAEVDFNNALSVLPTYTQAKEGLGKVAFAKGDTALALKYLTDAYGGLALAQYAVDIGDVYASLGDTTKSAQYYALAQVAFDTSVKSGVNTDLEQSLFLSDHELELTKAMEMATRAYAARPSIYGADYLSWALYKNGKFAEAAKYSVQALRLGKNDPLILFHQGMIALSAGDTAHAKEYLAAALKINPHFSIQYASVLKDTLNGLK